MELQIKDLTQLGDTAKKFVAALGESRVVAFYGSMGAGKTTFIKAICKELGAIDVVTSPTFTLVNEYYTPSDNALFHFDFYRINEPEEAFDFGFEEYIYSGSFCFIEWPEKIESLLPESVIRVYIAVNDDHSRTLKFEV